MRDEGHFFLGFVINQVLIKMFGWSDFVIDQLPAKQLEVLAAGFTLQLEVRNSNE